jgi:uncharacterized membrane protein YjgN (DUF898 family)
MNKVPDYTTYTLDELEDVYHAVDRNKYPDNFKAIVKEIEKRKDGKALETNTDAETGGNESETENLPVNIQDLQALLVDCATIYKSARSAYEEGDLQKARQLFKALIENYPDSHEAQYASGYIIKINRELNPDIDEAQYTSGYINKIGHGLKDGRVQDMKLEFNGSAKEYFRIWIVNLCLTLLTAGIFSAWAKVRKKRYFYSHLTLDGTPFQYLAQPIPILKGRVIAAVLFMLYYATSNFFTALFPYVLGAGLVIAPWVIVQSAAFNARYSAYRNMTFRFDGTYKEALKVISVWGIVPAIVIGTIFDWWGKAMIAGILYGLLAILFPWWIRNLRHFIVTKTSYGGHSGQFGATGGEFFGVYFVSGLIIAGLAFVTGIFTMDISIVIENKTFTPFLFAIPVYAGYIFGFAYVQANLTNATWNKIRLGPVRFFCTLKSFDLAKLYLSNAVGIIVSAGLLIPWAVIRTYRYRVDHTQVLNVDELTKFRGSETDRVQAAGAELSEFFDMDLSL